MDDSGDSERGEILTAGPDAVADRMLSTARRSAAIVGSSAPFSLSQTISPEKACSVGDHIRDLLDATAGVEHRCQQSIVAASLDSGPVDGLENRVDLFILQVVDSSLSGALEGNAEDTLGQFEMLWVARGHKMKKRMNGRKSHVSRGHTVLAFLFKVGQERKDPGRVQIR